MITIQVRQNARTLIIAIISVFLCCVFIHLRYVCQPPQHFRTTLFFAYCFFLLTPCLYLLFKVLLPDVLRVFFLTYYLFFALFPYKLLFPATTDLCQIYTYPPPQLRLGLDRCWALVLYGILALLVTVCWAWYHRKQWRWQVQKKEFGMCLFLLLVTAVQILPRLAENSPVMIHKGIYRDKELCNNGSECTTEFFGYCVMCDQPHWTVPNGFFKGVHLTNFEITKSTIRALRAQGLSEKLARKLKALKDQQFAEERELLAVVEQAIGREQTVRYQQEIINNSVISLSYKAVGVHTRILNTYFYALLEPLIHPYYAAILVNGTFFYLVLLAGYALVKYLQLHATILLTYPLLLSAHGMLHGATIDTAFSSSNLAFFFFILVIGYKLQIYSSSVSLTNKFLFCTVLACSGLLYEPYVKTGFIFLWGGFYAIHYRRFDRIKAGKTLLHACIYAVVTFIPQRIWLSLVAYYDLQKIGIGPHAGGGSYPIYFLSQIPSVPSFFAHNISKSILVISEDLVQLLIYNPLTEYLPILGVMGLVCLVTIFPKYVNREAFKGMGAMYLANILIPLLISFMAKIPPATYNIMQYTAPHRANGYLPVIVLAQSIGLYHIAKLGCRWMPPWLKPKYITYCAVLFIFIFSYHQLLTLY